MFLDELYLENDNTLVEEEEMQFCEGVDGLFEIALESEMSWNNIVMDTVKEEFVAIKNESQVLLEEAKKGFFQTIIDWIKKKAKQVAEFFKRLFEKIKTYFMNIDKFVEKYREKIEKFSGSVEVSAYKWKSNATSEKIMSDLSKVTSKISDGISDMEPKVLSTDDLVKKVFGNYSLSEVNKAVFGKVRSEKPVKQKFGADAVKAMFNDLKSTQGKIKALNTSKDISLKSLKDMEYIAKKGLSLLDKKENSKEIEQIKNSIQSYKNAQTVVDKLVGLEITIMNQKLSDSLRICRAAVVGGKGVKEEKAKKESANLFALI